MYREYCTHSNWWHRLRALYMYVNSALVWGKAIALWEYAVMNSFLPIIYDTHISLNIL